MTNKEYEEVLLENLRKYLKQIGLHTKENPLHFNHGPALLEAIEDIWLEATRQADIRNSVK